MIAFGVAQSVTNFRIQSSSHLSLSLSGTAAAMIVSGFLNVSRARHCDGLTRAFSAIGNLLILVLAVGLHGRCATTCYTIGRCWEFWL